MTDNSDILKAAYFTLGCKLNFAESSTIGKLLAERGIVRAATGETPDICVVNTCSVTEMADKKGRQLVRRLATRYPDATIVVTGCYAQLKPDEAASLPGVDIVLGSDQKLLMADYIDRWRTNRQKAVAVTPTHDIKTFRHSCERGDRTRYFLKVQDGCDYFCTYCTIPYARGRSRSGNTDELIALARQAAAQGGREIVITGVNIGEFGRDSGESFFELLKRLDAVESIERYRISSIEPNLLTDDIIDWIADEARAFMPHFHIPLQSGSDTVLRLMNRRYDTTLFRHRLEYIRNRIPDAFIGVDIIAGARGETPEEWKHSFDFATSLPVTRFHVFPYSERPGTSALHLANPVSQHDKHLRVKALTDLSDRKLHDFMTFQTGLTRPVLWEGSADGVTMHGLTDNYLRVSAPLHPELVNTVGMARLERISANEPDTIEAICL
ncbi:MAG: tRNA (N(6)-L-threonylcarbamoyladenosine(37)-C(2))-methylthiotransferase MtaB [Muribaculaceae bacterium]|nr:tRNA (N(6)-L-threonylcarbamoyladenosine(37)-C(2))-methylthiotransferase MtaB [Muribaculaceae bacterium]